MKTQIKFSGSNVILFTKIICAYILFFLFSDLMASSFFFRILHSSPIMRFKVIFNLFLILIMFKAHTRVKMNLNSYSFVLFSTSNLCAILVIYGAISVDSALWIAHKSNANLHVQFSTCGGGALTTPLPPLAVSALHGYI